MAVMMGVEAIMMLEVADVSVSMPVLKKTMYNVNPIPPADTKYRRSFLRKGFRIWLNFPMIIRKSAAMIHRTRPRELGENCRQAIFVRGKADAHKKTVIKAQILSLSLSFIFVFTSLSHEMPFYWERQAVKSVNTAMISYKLFCEKQKRLWKRAEKYIEKTDLKNR